MAIEAVKVPADIQVEEKIIGPIGLRQIFILIGTGGLSYILWTMAKNAGANVTFQIFSWIPLVIGAAFGFVKIHDVTLLRLLLLTIEKLQKPPRRTFGPRTGITITVRTSGLNEKKKIERRAPETQEKIQELSDILDTKMHEAAQGEKEIIESGHSTPDQISVSNAENGPNIDGMHREKEQDTAPPKEQGIFHDITPPSAA